MHSTNTALCFTDVALRGLDLVKTKKEGGKGKAEWGGGTEIESGVLEAAWAAKTAFL